MAIPTSRILRPSLPSAPCDVTRSLFAAPTPPHLRAPLARFSTSPSLWKGDNNKNRGRSAVRRTGVRPRQTLSVREKDFAAQQLPKPVEPTSKITGDPDHGLYEFFRNKELLRTPADEARHGRAWTVHELRDRDWETLQQLWWVCVKERNRLATAKLEHQRQKAGYGGMEMDSRDKTVQETMKAILDTLAERNEAYKDAFKLAKKDQAIDLSRNERQWQEPTYEVDEMYEPELEDPKGVVPEEAYITPESKSEVVIPEPTATPASAPSKEQSKQPNAL